MLNFFISLYKKNSSFSFIFYYLKRFYVLCNRFLSKIHYLMLSEYLQMISHFLFISIKLVRFHRFNSAFNSFDFKFTSCNIIC